METVEINNINENQKSNCATNNISKKFNKMIEILQMDKLDEDECDIINKKLDAYKEKQKIEIENLERQLNELKYQNSQIINSISNDNLKTIIKKEIIKDIEQNINEILKQKENEFSQKQEEINKKNEINNQKLIKSKFLVYEHKYITTKFEELKNKKLKINEIQEKPHIEEPKQGPENKKITKKLYIINKNKEKHSNNIRSSLSGNIEDNLNNSKTYIKPSNNKIQNYFQDEEKIKNDDNKQIQNINNYNNQYMKDINKTGSSLYNMKGFKKEQPMIIKENYLNLENKKNPEEKKKPDKLSKLFIIFNAIFFTSKEQISFKKEKINEYTYAFLSKKYNKFKQEGRESELIDYFDNFLKVNVFKIFERKIDDPYTAATVEYNIKAILSCFNINKNIYEVYFKAGGNTSIRDRKKSTEAALKFRKVFNVGEDVINEEQLLKRLDRNNYDINKVFQQLYG